MITAKTEKIYAVTDHDRPKEPRINKQAVQTPEQTTSEKQKKIHCGLFCKLFAALGAAYESL